MKDSKKILVVEDSEYKMEEIRGLMEKYRIDSYDHADNIISALAILSKTDKKIDVIILDMQFPWNNGILGAPDKNAGVQFIYEMQVKKELEELDDIPKIIGFSTEDFGSAYDHLGCGDKDEFYSYFIGQSGSILGVEQLLKKVIDA